jgi:hypothetical protein
MRMLVLGALFRFIGRIAFASLLAVSWPLVSGRAQCPSVIGFDQQVTVIRTTLMASDTARAAFNTDQPVTLSFSLSALQKDAEVTKAEFRLRLSRPRDDPDFKIAVDFEPTKKRFGIKSFGSKDLQPGQSATWNANSEALEAIKAGIGGDIRLTMSAQSVQSTVATREWYGPAAKESRLRPRLIISFRVPGAQPQQAVGVPASVSAAAFGDAAFFDFVSQPGTGLVAYPLTQGGWNQGELQSLVPALGDGLTYVVVYRGAVESGKPNGFLLEARSSLSGASLWSVPFREPLPYVLPGRSGQLYVVGKGHVSRLQIDPRTPTAAARAEPLLSVHELDPKQAPALGPDGSLYTLNNGSILALDPNFRELWSIPLGHNGISPITVGPTGCSIYLVSAGQVRQSSRGLLAIDAATGDERSSSLSNQTDLDAFVGSALHAPVVLLHSDGTEKVYVAANSGSGGVLAEFDKSPRDAGVTPGWTQHSLWSQPLALPAGKERDGNNKWQIIGGSADSGGPGPASIKALDWIDGTIAASRPIGEIDRQHMASSAIPAIDGAGTFFLPVRKTNGQPAVLASSPSAPERLLDLRDPTGAQTQPLRRLMIGPDGALYGLFPDDKVPYRLLPTIRLDRHSAEQVKLCRETPLVITGEQSNATISSGGGVILGPDTRLEGKTSVSFGGC